MTLLNTATSTATHIVFYPLTVPLTEADILVTAVIILGIAATVLLIQGLLELAFTIMMGGATTLALWAVASTLPVPTKPTFLIGLIILTVWFLIEA